MSTASIIPSTAGVGVSLRAARKVFPPAARGDREVVAVDGVSLLVTAGEFVAILGPSGCGKSTLLRIVAGLEHADGGEVNVGSFVSSTMSTGRPARLRIAYVFQDAHLLPWRNVLGNVALPLELSGVDSTPRHEAAMRAIEQVGLADAASRYPGQLSGGMRMRVSLARALVTDPQLLLLDEPFAALDEITRHGLDEQLRSLWMDRRITVLFVTHSINEAVFLAQRAVVLTRRPAQVVIDRKIDLPMQRAGAIRATPEFARESGHLLEALSRGGAMA